jgi:hypothetical protein
MPLTKIQSLGITDGTIVNADINASAAIAGTKLSGAGKVLQVITATDETERSTTSTSYVTASNTLSVTITPSSASNKIYLLCTTVTTKNTAEGGYITIYRGATNLGTAQGLSRYSGGALGWKGLGISILDSPSSTSALTYQVYIKSDDANQFFINAATKASITAFEIAG